jgi:Fe-S cluster assembly ATP-binding protein
MKLQIKNLTAYIENKIILNDLNLNIGENEIHVIMGPNGSGKSTLAKILAGHPAYDIKDGTISFHQKDLLSLSPEERAKEGIFLSFQSPLEIPGVTNYEFLRMAYNEHKKFHKQQEITPVEFMSIIEKKSSELKIPQEFLSRDLNQGFSGGERKKNEILQMSILRPDLLILDELDSGLDIDAMKLLCSSILRYRVPGSSILLITHYPRILTYLPPNFIHVFLKGQIVKTGDSSLIHQIETKGYESFL